MRKVNQLTILSVAFASASLSFSDNARADWQYTKWGMSPEEVCAASSGAVTEKPLTAKEQKSKDRLATFASGTFVTGKFKFFALFGFERKERKLEQVTLLYVGSSDVPSLSALGEALQEKYGVWRDGIIWFDTKDNYSLKFSISQNIGFLTYEPLHREEAKAL